MYILKVKSTFDSAHFLKGYEGKCANIHGHRWVVEIEVSSESVETEGTQRGMVVDFGILRDDLKHVTEKMDHTLIYELGSLKASTVQALESEGFALYEVGFRPTAENFAKYFYGIMKEKGYSVLRAGVYETPENYACYEECRQ